MPPTLPLEGAPPHCAAGAQVPVRSRAYVRTVAEAELDTVTDNPLFFPDGEPWDLAFVGNWPPGYDGRRRAACSAGNFHGQPLALAADFLAIALAELASISERRIQMLLDGNHNRGLPSNLVAMGGVNSGYMIAQYTAASLVSENKGLAHPASVEPIPSSANIEDHVSMSTIAARKVGAVLHHAQVVLGIELMVAAQAVEWRVSGGEAAGTLCAMKPETTAPTVEAARAREAAFVAATLPAARERRAAALGRGTGPAYLAVRKVVPPLIGDRYLERDLRRMTAHSGHRDHADRSIVIGAKRRVSGFVCGSDSFSVCC